MPTPDGGGCSASRSNDGMEDFLPPRRRARRRQIKIEDRFAPYPLAADRRCDSAKTLALSDEEGFVDTGDIVEQRR